VTFPNTSNIMVTRNSGDSLMSTSSLQVGLEDVQDQGPAQPESQPNPNSVNDHTRSAHTNGSKPTERPMSANNTSSASRRVANGVTDNPLRNTNSATSNPNSNSRSRASANGDPESERSRRRRSGMDVRTFILCSGEYRLGILKV
jgi:hypothetical protein